jgi:integrase/recombinase XerC
MAGDRAARGGLYRNPGGTTYKFRYKQGGKEIYGDTGCTSLGAAREWLLAHRQGAAQRKMGILTADNVPTLMKAMELWKTATTGVVTEKYANQKIDRLTNHLSPELVLPIYLIDTEMVEKARQRYLSGSWSGNGHRNVVEGRRVGGWNHLLRDLRALMSWAVKRGLIEAIPFRVAATKVQEDPASGVVIWPELASAFLIEVDRLPVFRQDTRTSVRLMLFLGLREDEAITSRWEWLDRRNLTYAVGDAKNRRARVIPVPQVLLDYIDAHHTRPAGGKGLLLPADEDGNPHGEGLTAGLVERAADAIGIQGMTPHRVRATFATAHFEQGTPVNQIQALLGHETPATTLGYIVSRPQKLAASQDRLAATFVGTSVYTACAVTNVKPHKQVQVKR